MMIIIIIPKVILSTSWIASNLGIIYVIYTFQGRKLMAGSEPHGTGLFLKWRKNKVLSVSMDDGLRYGLLQNQMVQR